jgi:hypothetical protein
MFNAGVETLRTTMVAVRPHSSTAKQSAPMIQALARRATRRHGRLER